MVTLKLDVEEVKVVRTALQSYLLDITRKEYPIHRVIRGILGKLPVAEPHEPPVHRKAG